jgi:hypothetical protein
VRNLLVRLPVATAAAAGDPWDARGLGVSTGGARELKKFT